MRKPRNRIKRSSNSDRYGRSRKVNDLRIEKTPQDLASRVRGLYRRIAQKLGVDPSYVSRIARGERRSTLVESTLRRELQKIVQADIKSHVGNVHKSSRKSASKG
jgi:transcriptional regulator with XRE-family HTH domain